jgi:hypothetical protein
VKAITDSFPIEEGREFLRLIERYDRFVNADRYAEEEAYAKACDPITGKFDEAKYEDPDDRQGEEYQEIEALVELTQSTELSEEERQHASEAITAAIKRKSDKEQEQLNAEHNEIWDAILASPFWNWLGQQANFQAAVRLFVTKRKFPRQKSYFDENGQEVDPWSAEFDLRGMERPAMERLREETYSGLEMDQDDCSVFVLLAAKSLIEYYEISDEDIRQYSGLRTLVRREVDKLRSEVLARAGSRPWLAQRLEEILPRVRAPRIDIGYAHPRARREWFIKDVADKYHYNFLCVHGDVIAALARVIDADIDPETTTRRVYAILQRVRPHLDDYRMDASRPSRYDPRF